MRLGIDVGGTFTDLVLINDETGEIHYTKTLTTPNDLAEGVLRGITKILDIAKVKEEQIEYIVHGTTIGTNALIERKGAKVGLITTAGFRDVLEIARVERPDAGLYDMTVDLPQPLVPRYLRMEVEERIGAQGEVVKPLNEATVATAAEKLLAERVAAIAVCLLFSFRNSTHERRIREICHQLNPHIPVTISAEIAPEFREFERTSTTVMNAYLLPITHKYIDALTSRLREKFGRLDLRIMQASGGAMTAEVAKSHAVNMVNSGPAGGALASALFGKLAGEQKVIGVDMGGTSFDVSIIVDGQPRIKSEGEIEGFPVKMPLMDVEGIGAGGGSIAWLDAGGALNIGPGSAGADPGPACYGRGGDKPTVTDANLILGRLNPDYFLGSEMPLIEQPASDSIRLNIAEHLDLSMEEAAAGILRVVNANMVRGISVNSTQKGLDVRDFSLLAFGGAGPLHAVELAQELGMSQVIIPPYCAVFSAFGAVSSDVRHDYVHTVALQEQQLDAVKLEREFTKLEKEALKQLAQENVPEDQIKLVRSADLRYEGQSYELTIPISTEGALDQASITKLIDDFHATHEQTYAYGDSNEAIEIISLRLVAIGSVSPIELRSGEDRSETAPRVKAERNVYFFGDGHLLSKIYERDDLQPGQRFSGPCLIEERTSTTVVPPGWEGLVDKYGNILIHRMADDALRSLPSTEREVVEI